MAKLINMLKFFLTLIASIFIAQTAGIMGSLFTAPKIQAWYVFLEKPLFAPPNWLFAPVWIILYILMGIAAFFIWQKRREPGAKTALYFYFTQLIFNALWSAVFFGLQNPLYGFAVIIILWLLIFATMIKFWKIEKFAGLLFIPYILWVSFAAALNLAIWQLNA